VRELTFTLRALPPFRLDLTVWALRRRPHNVVDRFDDGIWRRVLVIGKSPVALAVTQTRGGSLPEIEVQLKAAQPESVKPDVASIVTRMLGLERDLSDFYLLVRSDARMRELAERLRGMKPGMHVLNRLTEAFGVRGETMRSFPAAAAVAR
jgi:DNA-3-methyladenine glycosylase II